MKLVLLVFCLSLVTSAFADPLTRPVVKKKDRVLLVTVNFVTYGDPKYRWLYKFMEGSSVTLAQIMLKGSYRKIYLLAGNNATTANFVASNVALSHDPENRAVDTFVHLHGSAHALWFQDGGRNTSDLKTAFQASELKSTARLFYSTACYGSNHAQDFIDAGFQVASGSIGVNADSTYSYPATMNRWRAHAAYRDVLHTANNSVSIYISDKIAGLMGFKHVNSRKTYKGDGSAQIGLAPL